MVAAIKYENYKVRVSIKNKLEIGICPLRRKPPDFFR